jgi:hypothetical protein
MRLAELLVEYGIERAQHDVSVAPNFKLGTDGANIPPEHNILGSGYYSTARQNPDRPEDVIKGSRPLYPTSEKGEMSMGEIVDGYFVFVNALSKNDRFADNPYFPRIRKFEVYKQTDGRLSYTAELETLEKLNTLKKKEVGHIFRQAAGTEENYEALKAKVYPNLSTKDGLDYFPMMMLVMMRRPGGDHLIGNEHLREALRFIDVLAKRYKYNIDLHEGNLMVRRTPTGTQLVIVDPLGMPSW